MLFIHSLNESNWAKLKKKRKIALCAFAACKKLKGKFVCSSALLFIILFHSLCARLAVCWNGVVVVVVSPSFIAIWFNFSRDVLLHSLVLHRLDFINRIDLTKVLHSNFYYTGANCTKFYDRTKELLFC